MKGAYGVDYFFGRRDKKRGEGVGTVKKGLKKKDRMMGYGPL